MAGIALKDETARSLLHARVVFTGKLVSLPRPEAWRLVQAAGGQVATHVSRRTSLLVVGMDGWPVLPDGTVSRHLLRAEELNATGAQIEILPEIAFLERLGLADRRPAVRRGYAGEQVCDALGLDARVLARWEVLGLIRATNGRYDFQDLVALRTIAELAQRGVPLRTIGRTVRGLASVLPDVERPLAQLKLVEESGTLLAELGDALLAPDGQLVLNFSERGDRDVGGEGAGAGAGPGVGAGTGARAGSLPLLELKPAVAGAGAASADDWLDYGLDLETAERCEEAVEAYRRAIALRPRFPEAHFNLGNALRSLGRLDDAAEQWRTCVVQEPSMAAAWYNLASIQEEQGRLEQAIASLRSALAADPTYADAHYNLALCHERAGARNVAAVHWRAYLQLDREGPWADTARARLGL